jgi:hypothetical protein
VGAQPDHALGLERLRHPAQIPGIQSEPAPQVTQGRAVLPDLEQQPGLAQRAVLAEVVVVQYADAAREVPVEAAEGRHVLRRDWLHVL